MNETKNQQIPPRLSALLPILIFLIIYVGSGIYFQYIQKQDQGFYIMPVVVAFMLALTAALFQNKKVTFQEKLKIMAAGVGDENIIVMILIFLFAGAFSSLATAAGGSESISYFLLSIIPPNQVVLGFFLISCIISMAMGTSTGTISVLVPIGLITAQAAALNLPAVIATIVCGAMFGDNMSFISDTTIAATKTQGCEMKDKFKVNFFIALPAALVTILILLIGFNSTGQIDIQPYNIFQALPYFIVLVMALAGINVLIVLGSGIVMFAVVGLLTQPEFFFSNIFISMGEGTSGMFETIIVTILVSSMGALMKNNGGFAYILNFIKKRFKGNSGGQLGIALLSSVMDIATANNTVAIVMAAPIAKDISREYDIAPKKTASLMDIFSCIFQGLIPYGAQILIAIGLAAEYKLSAFDLMPYMYYIYLLLISSLISIFITKRKKQEKSF